MYMDSSRNFYFENHNIHDVGAAGMRLISGEMRVGGDTGKFVAPYTDAGTAYAGSFGWNHLNLGNNAVNYVIAGHNATGASLQVVVNNTSTITTNGSGHNGTLAMVIASNGEVGIGTDTDPDYKLDVQGTFRADGAASFGSTLGAGATTVNSLSVNGGGITNVASILLADYLSISGTGSGFGSASASWPLRIEADTNDDAQIQAYNDLYLRCADGNMYLYPNGDSWDDVYIGDGGALCRVHLNGTGAYTGIDWMDNGTWKWAAWYHTADTKLYFRRNASPDVDVMAFTDGSNDVVFTGNVTAYSDKRLKTNIKTIDSALDKVNQMRGVTYDRIDYPSSGAGVLAQELEEIAPELVDNTNKYKGVSYGNLTAYLVESIKELSDKMDKLENRSFWQRLRNHK